MHYFVGFIVGLAIGVFCPSWARKLKALFSAEAAKGSRLAEGEVKAAEIDIKKKL